MTVRGVLLLRSELWGVRREGDRGWGLKGVLGKATDATGVASCPPHRERAVSSLQTSQHAQQKRMYHQAQQNVYSPSLCLSTM